MKDEQFIQILRAINNVRDDLKDFKNDMNRRWEENERRWEENERHWEENERRWEENNKKWIANQKELDKIYGKIEQRYKDTRLVFDAYENSVENMYQDNRKKIIALEKRLKIAKA